MSYSRWVKGGMLFAVALPIAGCGGWVDVETTTSKDKAVAGGSTGDSGPRPAADARYGFYVIPGLLQAGEDGKEFDSMARMVSENGSLIVGTTAALHLPLPAGLPEMPGDQVYDGDSRYFYWTPGSATQPWDGPQNLLCLSGGGTAIFGGSAAGFTRWTPESGSRIIGAASGLSQLDWCSYDGTRAAGHLGNPGLTPTGGAMRAVLWAQGRWDDQVHPIELSPQVPDGAFGWVSTLGSVSSVTSYGDATHIYWADGDDELALLPQPNSNCSGRAVGRDGRVVISLCKEAAGLHLYRWTADTRTFTSMGVFDQADPTITSSADGSVVVALSGNRFAYFKDGATTNATGEGSFGVLGLSDDGATVYVEDSGLTSKAGRWTATEGFVPLESLPNLPCTALSYPEISGQHFAAGLAAGSSSMPSDLGEATCAWSPSRAVVWDSLGVRDIAAELKTAGVDLAGVELLRADRVWSESGVRVMGSGKLSNGAYRTWMARLPARN